MAGRLAQMVSGPVRTGADAARASRQRLWNADVAAAPLALLECRSIADVRRAVQYAAAEGLPVSVIGGGHDWAGRAICDGGLVLDLGAMTDVRCERSGAITAAGSATTRDLLTILPEDRAVVTAAWSSTGVVGVATGGGYGKLNRRFGLAADNILRAEVVLADGSLVVASDDEHADLLWALRGGGCNFGVVTSMTFATHPLPSVLTGSFFIPVDKAVSALVDVQAMLDAPDDLLSIHTVLTTMPAVGRGLLLSPLWCGEPAAGERRLERIGRLDGAQRLDQGWCRYKATIDPQDEAAWPKQGDYRMDAHNVPRFDRAVAEVLVDAARRFGSDQDAFILHDLFGAATRVPSAATAFARRDPHINVQVLAGRDPARDRDGDRRNAWLAGVRAAFAPWRSRGGYPNILGPDARCDARHFYGEAVPRLDRIKSTYDPQDRFPSNTGRPQ